MGLECVGKGHRDMNCKGDRWKMLGSASYTGPSMEAFWP